jgi:hypothetical protein
MGHWQSLAIAGRKGAHLERPKFRDRRCLVLDFNWGVFWAILAALALRGIGRNIWRTLSKDVGIIPSN